MLVEEFGLSHRFYSEEERMVVFAVIFDMLIDAKKSGRPFVGAMFWQAVKEGGWTGTTGGNHAYHIGICQLPSTYCCNRKLCLSR